MNLLYKELYINQLEKADYAKNLFMIFFLKKLKVKVDAVSQVI